jgi:hypothetical protein
MTKRLALLALFLLPAALRAHAGPPFPIVVDRPVGPWSVSVWTDPDIGTGVVFVILEGSSTPSTVRVGARPVDGGLPEAFYDAERQGRPEDARYFTRVSFAHGGMWRLRVTLDGPRGGGAVGAEVEATPDGVLGPGSILLYLAPFLAMGFLWGKAVLRRRGKDSKDQPASRGVLTPRPPLPGGEGEKTRNPPSLLFSRFRVAAPPLPPGEGVGG